MAGSLPRIRETSHPQTRGGQIERLAMRKVWVYFVDKLYVPKLVDNLLSTWCVPRGREELIPYIIRNVLLEREAILEESDQSGAHLSVEVSSLGNVNLSWQGQFTESRYIEINGIGGNKATVKICLGENDDRDPRDSHFFYNVLFGVDTTFYGLLIEQPEE